MLKARGKQRRVSRALLSKVSRASRAVDEGICDEPSAESRLGACKRIAGDSNPRLRGAGACRVFAPTGFIADVDAAGPTQLKFGGYLFGLGVAQVTSLVSQHLANSLG